MKMYVNLMLGLLYGVDSICTIFIRLSRKENVFEAHRSHLYQLLANERQLGHLPVAFGYAIMQVLINIVAFAWVIPYNPPFWILVLIVAASMLAYLLIRKQVDKRSFLNNTMSHLQTFPYICQLVHFSKKTASPT